MTSRVPRRWPKATSLAEGPRRKMSPGSSQVGLRVRLKIALASAVFLSFDCVSCVRRGKDDWVGHAE